MFFPRLRRHVKWMFVLLALVFGLGFVIFGVGAGGIGIGDYFRDAASAGGGDTPSVSKARDRTEKNPKDARAWRDLATAYQVKGDTGESIAALERYVELRPRDTDALRELAGLYLVQASNEQEKAQLAQERAAYLLGGGGVFTEPLKLGKDVTLGQDAVSQAVSAKVNEEVTAAYQAVQAAYANATDAYERLAKAVPDDPTVQITLAQTAQQSGDASVAIKAYEAFLKLAPDDPNAEVVREQLKQLEASQAPPSG